MNVLDSTGSAQDPIMGFINMAIIFQISYKHEISSAEY
jgi:hypothetical protein